MSVKDYRIEGDVITVTLRRRRAKRRSTTRSSRASPRTKCPRSNPQRTGIARGRRDQPPIRIAARGAAVCRAHRDRCARSTASIRRWSMRSCRPNRTTSRVRDLERGRPRADAGHAVHGRRIWGAGNLFDPQANLEAGVQYLKFLLTVRPVAGDRGLQRRPRVPSGSTAAFRRFRRPSTTSRRVLAELSLAADQVQPSSRVAVDGTNRQSRASAV